MSVAIRICTLCDQPYLAGMYAAHADIHVPVRRGRQSQTLRKDQQRERIAEALSKGTALATIARECGVSRQRIHQIAKADPATGRCYRADSKNAFARRKRRQAVSA